jgi:hypothetical protein
MRPHELESWVLQIVGRVESGQPIEDSRVELKAEWPDPKKAARQIAGHANAAHGVPILWLIGIDEGQAKVVGAANTEMADWYSQVKSQFNGLAPRVMVDLNVPTKSGAVVALLFETDRAPFVVANPAGGAIQFEVPWRENRATRTADRSDLIKILSPLQLLPDIELLGAVLQVKKTSAGLPASLIKLVWTLDLAFYIAPRSDSKLVIPFFRCSGLVGISGQVEPIQLGGIYMRPPGAYATGEVDPHASLTVMATINELLVEGPGKVLLRGNATTEHKVADFTKDTEITIRLAPAGATAAATINQVLAHDAYSQIPGQSHRWSWNRPGYDLSELR